MGDSQADGQGTYNFVHSPRISNQGYLQRIERSKKYLTHDENASASYFQPPSRNSDTPGAALRINDEVIIRNCPPISARKRFTLDQILRSPETQHELMHKNFAAASQSLAS